MTMTSERKATVTLPTDTQILIVREFDAPAALVYRAWTEPDLVRRWWHAKRGEITRCDIDLQVGGAWAYALRTPTGQDVSFHGEFRELVPGERIVSTEIYDPFPEETAVNTLTFTERDGRTRIALLVEHTNPRARDMHVESGMEDRLQDALDLLEEAARSL